MSTEIQEVKSICYMRSHNSGNINRAKICIFERSNEKNNFSKTKIYFHKKTTPQLLGHIGLQNMKQEINRILYDLPRYFKFVLWMLTSSLKVFTNDRFKCVVVRAKCDQNFPSQLFVLLTVDEFVGRGGDPLHDRNRMPRLW